MAPRRAALAVRFDEEDGSNKLSEEHDGELRAPLMRGASSSGLSFGGAVINLTKAVVGAGMLAVPKAMVLLGTVGFAGGFVLVSVLTVLTINYGLVYPSVAFDRRGTALRLGTYPAAVRHWVGGAAERVLVVTMLAGLLLAQTSYFDIFSDILVGDESNPGLLASLVRAACGCKVYASPYTATQPTLLSDSSELGSSPEASWLQLLTSSSSTSLRPHTPSDLQGPGLWLSATPLHLASVTCAHHDHHNNEPPSHLEGWLMWLLDRRVALALVVLVVLLPLSLKRHMGATNAINAVGVAALGAFLATVVTLAVATVRAGQAHTLPLWPDWAQLTGGAAREPGVGAGAWAQWVRPAASALGVVSVLLTANSCYSNVHPLLGVVRPFTRARAGAIVGVTLALTTSFYFAISVCAYLAFGRDIKGDVLQNLSPAQMEPLVGPAAAQAMALAVRFAYLVSIVASAVLSMFPLRQVLADSLLGAPPQPASLHVLASGPHGASQHLQAPEPATPHAGGAAPAPASLLSRAQSDAFGFAATLSSDDEDEEGAPPHLGWQRDGELGWARWAKHRWGPRKSAPGGLKLPFLHEQKQLGKSAKRFASAWWPRPCAGTLLPHAAQEELERGEQDGCSSEASSVVGDEAWCGRILPPLVVLPGPASGAQRLLACRSVAAIVALGPVGRVAHPLAVGLEQLQLLQAASAHEADLALAQAVERHAAWRQALHVPLTLSILALTFVLAVVVPNIWMVMSLLGSVSASIVSFVMPALVGLFALQPLRLIGVGRTWGLKGVLHLTTALGLLIFANGWLTLALA